MENLVFSIVETELRKLFFLQQQSKSVMDTFLTFTILLTSYWYSFFNWILRDIQSIVEYFWHSNYNVHRADIQFIIDLILNFSMSLAPYWHLICNWLIHSLRIFSLSFIPYWHSVYHSLLTDNMSSRIIYIYINNTLRSQWSVRKTTQLNSRTICLLVTNLLNFRCVEEIRTVGLKKRLWVRRSQISNSSKGEKFLSIRQLPERLLEHTASRLVCIELLPLG